MSCDVAKMINCFWCGETKAVGLINSNKTSRAYKEWCDMPMGVVADYDPCDKCKEDWEQGFLVLEGVTKQPEDKRPPMQVTEGRNIYPTGRNWVLREEVGRKVFNTPPDAPSKVIVDPEVAEKVGLNDIPTNS